jgi:hypothetical protein
MSKKNPKCDVHMYKNKKKKCKISMFVTTIFGGLSVLHL